MKAFTISALAALAISCSTFGASALPISSAAGIASSDSGVTEVRMTRKQHMMMMRKKKMMGHKKMMRRDRMM